MKLAIRHIGTISTGRNLLLLGGLFLLMALLIMPAAGKDLQSFSNGVPPLDLSFYYSPATAQAYMDAYGKEGRKLYLFTELTADVVYPVIYTLFFCVLLGWLVKNAPFPLSDKLVLLPLFVFTFDILENAGIVWLLVKYPQPMPLVAAFAGVFTSLKWVSFAITLGTVMFIAARWAFNAWKHATVKT